MVSKKRNLIEQLFSILNRTRYAVLRNYEHLPAEMSRDIDLIIERDDFYACKQDICKLFENYGFRIFMYYKGSEMHTLIFARNDAERIDIVSIDFLFSIYVRNYILYEAKEVLSSRVFSNGFYHVRRDQEYLAKYTYNSFLGAKYPDKYSHIRKEAIDLYLPDIQTQLCKIGVAEVDSIFSSFKVKRYLWSHFFVRTFFSSIRYIYCSVSNFLSPQGVAIAFTGPDGSGKTTIINSIKCIFDNTFSGIKLFHFRPQLYGNISNVAYNAGLKKKIDNNYEKPHRGNKTGILSSILRFFYYAFDYFLGYFIKIKKQLFARNIVIFDRYYTDIICDSRRSRINLSYKFLYWFGRVFIPSLDYNILLTAKSETILARKKELNEEGIRSINEKIDYLADKPGYYKVLNEGTPDEAVSKILEIIFEKQHRKNLKRI